MGCCVSSPVVVEDEQQQQQQQDGGGGKKEVLQNFSAEAKADALLAMIPGRMFANGASNNACIFTQQGRKGTNQDAMVVWENFASMEDTVFCGVFDGHGPFGHFVARRVRDSVPSKLLHYWEEQMALQAELKQSTEQWSNGHHQNGAAAAAADDARLQNGASDGEHPAMFETWRESHLTSYRVMDRELRSHPGIDCFCSGTTAVTVLKQGKHLVIGNVGDSRAILGTKDDKGAYTAVQLTVDLKPNLPREAERIRQCRGRVFALHDEPEVSRVWLPFDDSPGLAMARAFGDFCLKDYGVIAVPEMSYRQLTDRDQFIVLATDGIWDVLSNDEVVQVVAQAPTRATAARALVESAVRVWRLKYPTSKVDDCAVVCLYVDQTYSQFSSKQSKPTTDPATASSPSPSPRGEISPSGGEPSQRKSKQPRKLADWLGADTREEEEWSALEGVTRVNSLLNLPRFLAGDKRRNAAAAAAAEQKRH
jgi:serine/threonine protein phosphatase PrpC